MSHTPGYQPVKETSEIYSKNSTQSIKSRIYFYKQYKDDVRKDEDFRKIVRHTIGEEEPAYDIKHILKHLKKISD